MALPPDFFVYVAIGLAAQLVDGALGMAYGVTSSSLLAFLGIPPALASASVHAAEVATTGVSGISHGLFGNVDGRLLLRLAVPGVVGGVIGAWALSQMSWPWLRVVIAAYLMLLGAKLLLQAVRNRRGQPHLRRITLLGFGAGLMDAIGGGGWGSITTTHLLASHLEPRIAIGTANAAEFFVSVAISLVFIATIGISHTPVVLGLLVGGVIAAPFAAWLTKRLPARGLLGFVGLFVMGLSAYNLSRALA